MVGIFFLVVISYFCIPECIPGYIGLKCTLTCPYPSYGERCQGYCDCSSDTCDLSTGCSGPKTQITGTHF